MQIFTLISQSGCFQLRSGCRVTLNSDHFTRARRRPRYGEAMTIDHQQEHRTTDAGWSPVLRFGALGVAILSLLLFLTGFYFTIPVSVGLLVLSLLARRGLGRTWVWVLLISIAGVLLSVGWMLISLSVNVGTPPVPAIETTPSQ